MKFPPAHFVTSPSGLRSGPTPWRLHHDFRQGRLVRLRRGVYLPTAEWLAGTAWDRYALTIASLAVTGRSPVFCRETGLALWGVGLRRVPLTVDFLTPLPQKLGRRPLPGLYGDSGLAAEAWAGVAREGAPPGPLPPGFRDALRLGADDGSLRLRVPILGLDLRVQAFDDLLFDTIHRLTFDDAVVVLDQVLSGGGSAGATRTREDLLGICGRLPSNAARRRMSEALALADPRSESVGESWSRALIHRLGFEAPELQHRIPGPQGEIARTDFFWPEARLVGEFDGLVKYLRAQDLRGTDPARVVVEEKRREDRIRAEGYGVVRWVWDDLRRPERFAALLLRAGVPRRGR
ncbi:hypothetical protein [Arthrobacter sp. Y-9]|uniref:hypothetical protein n=1 Tax=Arthrobacter sp. Y-9 TaxID=3039385 RepID=UPI00241C7A27|nr:hypothetical protein [Arthrobacter sp. Y-9]WFR84157.1 hypothetical protein P9849_00450 [Arthrobacter sp. Y-9]